MKLVIVGGHLSPALCVIEALPKETQILFVGRKHTFEGDKAVSLEYKTIKSLSIQFSEITSGRLQRKITRHTINSLLKLPLGLVQALFILLKFKPDVVLSLGGYLSPPVVISAWILRIPVVIHEQTLEVGLSNRFTNYFAKKICISWETSRKYFPKSKTVLTGNPVRRFKISELRFKIANEDKGLPIIYITGGSAGSHYINTLVEGCIKRLLKKFVVIHQTGDSQEFKDFDNLNIFRNSLPIHLKSRYFPIKFVDPNEVGSVLQKADLVIARSGINTVTELIFFKKPSLLIPIPVSQKDEQKKNALFLKSLGLGEVYYQDTLDSKKLLRFIEEMINNKGRYKLTERFWIFDSPRWSSRLARRKSKRVGEAGQNDEMGAAQKIIEVLDYAKKSNKNEKH